MKLRSRDFSVFQNDSLYNLFFFLKPGTLNNCETMAQRGFKKEKEKKTNLSTLPALADHFKAEMGHYARRPAVLYSGASTLA